MFITVFLNVVVMLVYMSIGFILCKAKKADASHAKSMSGLLIYILSPAMIINSFLQMDYSFENLKELGLFFVTTLFVQFLFFVILYSILHKKYKDAKYRIISVGSVLGNVAFFGIPIITSLYPNEPIVSCYCVMYAMSMNLLVFTIGVAMLTNDMKYISVKSAILNPTTLSLCVAVPLYIFQVNFPILVNSSIELLAKMVTPVCMVILGMRLSTVSIKILFSRLFVYIACLMKLIVFPIFAYACVYFLPYADEVFKVSVFVLSATPAGAIIVSLAELHECEQELSANVVLLTTILSVITLPCILLFI